MNRRELSVILKGYFGIAVIIFFTALCSEFAVRMYYSSTDPLVQIFSGLLAILMIFIVMVTMFLVIPSLRRAILRIFGMEEG